MKKSLFSLNVHWKQGDDFAFHLEKADGDVVKALRSWAASFQANADALSKLAKKLEGKKVEGFGATHCIEISASKAVVASVLADKQLAAISPQESDHDDDEGEGEGEGEEG